MVKQKFSTETETTTNARLVLGGLYRLLHEAEDTVFRADLDIMAAEIGINWARECASEDVYDEFSQPLANLRQAREKIEELRWMLSLFVPGEKDGDARADAEASGAELAGGKRDFIPSCGGCAAGNGILQDASLRQENGGKEEEDNAAV